MIKTLIVIILNCILKKYLSSSHTQLSLSTILVEKNEDKLLVTFLHPWWKH